MIAVVAGDKHVAAVAVATALNCYCKLRAVAGFDVVVAVDCGDDDCVAHS